jgi:hypothetical protein
MGPQRVSVSLQIAAKDTDDIRTLFLGDTIRELQINNVTSAAATLNFTFKGVYFSAVSLGLDGNEEIWQVDLDENSIIKNGVNEILTTVAKNSQSTFLVAA